AKKIKNEISVKYHGKKIIFLGFSFEQLWLRKQSKKLATFATWGGYADVNQSKILSWVNSNLEEKIQIEKSDKTEGELQYDNRSENYRQNIR
ncbi:MAG: hypothetical protein HN833_04785, partial [Elusimicrobiaceae bacterium]|nr:hypothetical protein [Elusimicrobiaceae bacterium]